MTTRIEKTIIALATLILLIAFVNRLYTRGGPYFQLTQTIVDHVGPNKHETRDALVLLPKIRPLLPRGAQVACFRPINGAQNYDTPNFLTAIGQLPDQKVQPSFFASLDTPSASLVDYVIAVRDPFTHPAYHIVAEFPEGRLYKVAR
ncbi:MAG TPA: hypothetical protein VKL19_06765 [Thermoanaerobaculia bacterium]|nr:hypothetical protein [Thermoanaerobaculia bacterium]